MELLATKNRQVFSAPFIAKLKTARKIVNANHFGQSTMPKAILHYI